MFGKKKPAPKKKTAPKLSEKEKATRAGEPWVDILEVNVDPEDINNGAFELDWNIYFVNQLRAEGYQGVKDEDVVDQWFQKVCRNVALETWENYDADPDNRTAVKKVKREDGKTEVS